MGEGMDEVAGVGLMGGFAGGVTCVGLMGGVPGDRSSAEKFYFKIDIPR